MDERSERIRLEQSSIADLGGGGHARRAIRCLVLGTNDVASAVAWELWRAEYAVIVSEEPRPAVTRRGMAFADAVFDGAVELAGVWARRVDDAPTALLLLERREAIPLLVGWPVERLVAELRPEVLIDARMRKHAAEQPVWRGLVPLTIGLGPGFAGGREVDVAVETSREALGLVRWTGENLPLAGEPRPLAGYKREQYRYAPVAGMVRTQYRIGDPVEADQLVAVIETPTGERVPLTAPISGVLRGLVRDGVPVSQGAKVLEVDPRGAAAQVRGINERAARIAVGVRAAIAEWAAQRSPTR